MAIAQASAVRRTAAEAELEAMLPPVPVLRFTVDDYELMIRNGILKHPERLELLDGWIVPKMTHNARHDSAVYRLQRRLAKLLGENWVVRAQSSIKARLSVPEPDVVVAPGPEDRYDSVRPVPGDLALVAEVAESTLRRDQG